MADTPTAPAQATMTAEGRYNALEAQRSTVLEMGRKCSKLTIPSLLPPEDTSDTSQLEKPYQSIGARGVDNLASKLLLALFPPGASFFRLKVEPVTMEQFVAKSKAAGATDPTGDIETALSRVEKAVLTELETKNSRPALSEGFKHLVVAGNVLLQLLPKGGIKMHPLSRYVVKRDGEGEVFEIVLREGLSRATLPEPVRAIVESQSDTKQSDKETTETIWLYTWVKRKDNETWSVHQEVKGITVPDSAGTYAKDSSAWLPVRWNMIAGSDYGRGRCEEFFGDLNSLESLQHAIVDFAANASKVVWLKDPGGVTEIRDIEEAETGDIVEGSVKDVAVLQMEKFADFRVVKETADEIKQNLKEAFLLNSSVQRNAERVTAEEIRFMAGELEQALGGTYSIFSQELQRPLVSRLLTTLQKRRKLPALPKNLVHPEIITGLDGLGRANDMVKLDLLLQGAGQTFGQEAVAEYTNIGGYLTRRAAALAIDGDGIIRTEEEVQKARALRAQQELMNKTAPASVKAMSDHALAANQAGEQQAPQTQQQ